MRQPYASGLLIAPDGFWRKVSWRLRRLARRAFALLTRPLDLIGFKRLRVMQLIWAKDRIGREVSHVMRLHDARSVDISQPQDQDFVRHAKNYSDGALPLAEVCVSEVSPAVYYPALGLVANENFEVFQDSILLPHRFHLSDAYRSLRPLRVPRIAGPVSSIQRIDAYNFWHWMADCLPQLLTLEKYMHGRPLTLLISDNLGGFQRETLNLVAPRTMTVKELPAHQWIRTDRFILPSYLSGLCNGYLQVDYYAEIRRRIARGLGLPERAEPELRIYLSRSGALRRRVANEGALVDLLREFGFTTVRPETLSMREQVSLFQRAQVIVAPHGAALGGIIFAPRAKILVLYPERNPGEYFFTMARRVGAQHFALIHDFYSEEDALDDFPVDLERMKAMLEGPMDLERQ